MTKLDVFVAGVGGQGVLTASRILGTAAIEAGLNVQIGEIHGMAQRGGSVEATVRIGRVWGPLITDGDAEVILGFDPLEAARALGKANDRTLAIVNTHVAALPQDHDETYPPVESLLSAIQASCGQLIAFDATALARSAGTDQALGTVLIGALARHGNLPFGIEDLQGALASLVPGKWLNANRNAFDLGRTAVPLANRAREDIGAVDVSSTV
jgi:indolepyruvate ferredoxin oxidoreductase, beta subunit